MPPENAGQIQLDANDPEVWELSAFGFTTSRLSDHNAGETFQCLLQLDELAVNVAFRIRQQTGNESVCTFMDLALANREKIDRFVRAKAHLTVADESLDGRSYDELAKGLAMSGDVPAKKDAPKSAPGGKAGAKSMAMLLMLLALGAMVIVAVVFMRSRSSLSVDNSSLVGNYLPIHARVGGEIVDVHVKEGEPVKQGDVLLRLDNPEIRAEKALSHSEVLLGESKVVALKKKLKSYLGKVEVAKKRLAIDLNVARSDSESIEKQYDAARLTVERMEPYIEKAVSRIEFDEIKNEMLALEAKHSASLSNVQLAEFAYDMSKKSILMMGDRLDDEVGRITAELEIAQAELAQARRALAVATEREQELQIVAPRDGRVYAAYRQFGEYLRVADEAIALTYPGETWAAGMVTAGQAGRVRPGQPVTVDIPSLGQTLKGVVSAVGHRAMYGKGGYSAEFRGTTATDVPIKVSIAELPTDIPSGIRLDMQISTGFGLDWLDRMTGFELQPIHGLDDGNRQLEASRSIDRQGMEPVVEMTGFRTVVATNSSNE